MPYEEKNTSIGLFGDVFAAKSFHNVPRREIYGFFFFLKLKHNFIWFVLRGRVKFPIDGDEVILSP